MTLQELLELQDRVEALVVAGVMRARREGLSWRAIAPLIHVTPQEAHRRYAHIWKWTAAAEGIPLRDNERPNTLTG